MIGTILFFLVGVHLAIGILAALLALPSRALGPRFFRFNSALALTILGLAAAAYLFYAPSLDLARGSRALALKTEIDRSAHWLWAAGGLILVYMLALPFGRGSPGRMVLASATACGGAFLFCAAQGLAAAPTAPGLGGILFPADFFLSALALGSVMVCMILGHWYLVEPGMSVRPLQTVAGLFIGVVVARALLGAYTSVLLWRHLDAAGGDLLSGALLPNILFFAQRVLFGLVLPLALSWMIWQTVKIQSTQSATGILYVAVVFIFFGEFLSHYLLVSTGYPI